MQILKPEYIRQNERGSLIQVNTGEWKQVNYLVIKKDNKFGGHYHKHKRELFYLIQGKVRVEVKIDNPVSFPLKVVDVEMGGCFLIEPYETHTVYALENSALIELLSEPFTESDIYV